MSLKNTYASELTKFEIVRVIGVRATQIANGAPPTVEVMDGMTDPIEIARLEFSCGKIPIIVERKYPNGRVEEISVYKK
jgi:DNA-directed RNA polymerase subunit K/omega